jgi:hypothetical protein
VRNSEVIDPAKIQLGFDLDSGTREAATDLWRWKVIMHNWRRRPRIRVQGERHSPARYEVRRVMVRARPRCWAFWRGSSVIPGMPRGYGTLSRGAIPQDQRSKIAITTNSTVRSSGSFCRRLALPNCLSSGPSATKYGAVLCYVCPITWVLFWIHQKIDSV